MNISNEFRPVQNTVGESQVSSVGRPSSKSYTSGSSGAEDAADQAHLSSAASLASQATSLPDVRMEKVQSIQAALADGSYNVSATDVAHSLMSHMLAR